MNKLTLKLLFLSTAGFVLCTGPNTALAQEGLKDLVTDGDFFGAFRYRYEFVDQDGITNNANAQTVRANLGFKTGQYKNFQGLFETQLVQNLGGERFNDLVNGNTDYPVVADADNLEINQAYVSWTGLPDTRLKVGRQSINLDNQRFVGTVGWRQNDQSFDAAQISYTGLAKTDFQYGHIWNVNRIFGDDHPLGDLDSQSHFARIYHQHADWLNVTGYGYWLSFKRLPAGSSRTYGLRTTGKLPLTENWTARYEAELAQQQEYQDNPASYSENYYHIAPSVSGYGFTAQAGYERLGGDGSNAFQTPLATLHKFNGWADKFLSTPAEGLEDFYGKASYKISTENQWMDDTTLTAVYHDFQGDESGDFGTELDLSIGKSFALPAGQPFERVNVLLKYADYNAEDAPYTDTQKFWFQMGVNF